MEAKQRQTNFELLRLISMFLIVMGHCIMHGLRNITSSTIPDIGIDPSAGIDMFNFSASQLLGYVANVGVNLFILITGYFITKPNDFHKIISKSFRLWRQIAFYCLTILILSCLIGYKQFEINDLITAITPIYHNTYWFMTQYIALFLISPFLARLLSILEKRDYMVLLIILFVLNFQQESIGYGQQFSSGMTLFFFIFLFCIGGYIRRFNPLKKYQKYGALIYFAICVLMAVLGIVLQIRNLGTPGHEFLYIKGIANNSIPLFSSVALFLWFSSIRITNSKVNKIILLCSPHVLGIYLIHDNPIIRDFFWGHVKDYIHEIWFIPGIILYVSIIFVACLSIESLRAQASSTLKKLIKRN